MSKKVEKVKEEIKTEEVVEVKKPTGKKFYADIEHNKKERRKSLIMAGLLVIMMGGMGMAIMIGGNEVSYMMGAIMLVFMVLGISMVPSAFKQYPINDEPLITVNPKEATIAGETVKVSDILEMRLTITLPSVGGKDDNLKFIEEVVSKEPEKGLTADLDFVVKGAKKNKTLYTTISGGYEALLAMFNAGVKHYTIYYSLKKLNKLSEYNIMESVNDKGVKLGEVSKKDRLKQLW